MALCNCFCKSKKTLLVFAAVFILATLTFIVFKQSKALRINLEDRRYFKQYVKVEDVIFRKAANEEGAIIYVVIENSGNRILDSLPLEINYYNAKGKFLSRDNSDILKFISDIILPNRRKTFQLNVTCPKETVAVKIKIKS